MKLRCAGERLQEAKQIKKITFGRAKCVHSGEGGQINMKGFSKLAHQYLPNLEVIEVAAGARFTNFEVLHDRVRGGRHPGLSKVRSLKMDSPRLVDEKMSVKLPYLRELDLSERLPRESDFGYLEGDHIDRIFIHCPRIETYCACNMHALDVNIYMPRGRSVSFVGIPDENPNVRLSIYAPRLKVLSFYRMYDWHARNPCPAGGPNPILWPGGPNTIDVEMLRKGHRGHAEHNISPSSQQSAITFEASKCTFTNQFLRRLRASGRFRDADLKLTRHKVYGYPVAAANAFL